MASPFPFTAGQVLTAAQLNGIGEYSAYTPTFTDISFSSYTARYAIVNKLLHVWFSGILDAAVTGAIEISAPVETAPSNTQAVFGGSCYGIDDNTGGTYFGRTLTRSDDTFRFYSSTVDGSSASGNQWDATAPFTWASGDLLSFSIVVEAS